MQICLHFHSRNLSPGTELGFHGGNDPNNRESMWPEIDENPQDNDLYAFIKSSIDLRRQLWSSIRDSYAEDK